MAGTAGHPRLHIDGRNTGLHIRQALSWWTRALGLLATPRLDDPCGLWISPCPSVHTGGMRYAIDVVFLARDGRILKLCPALRPWRAAGARGAHSTLDLRAGLAQQLDLRPGQVLTLQA
jgi:uncharacterized membrane protein (UPF0127 family)